MSFQELVLSDINAWLPENITELTVYDCRQAEVKFIGFGEIKRNFSLQKLSFFDVGIISLYNGGIDVIVSKGNFFILSIKRVAKLQITRGSIRLTGAHSASAIVIENALIPILLEFSIETSNLKLLQLKGLIIEREVQQSAISVASSNTVVVLHEVDAQYGIQSGWIGGQIQSLIIAKCRLALNQGAFRKVTLAGSLLRKTSVFIQENLFSLPKSVNTVVLPSQLLDTLPSRQMNIVIEANEVQCRMGRPAYWVNAVELNKSKLRCAFYNTTQCSEKNLRSPKMIKCTGSTAEDQLPIIGLPNIALGKSYYNNTV